MPAGLVPSCFSCTRWRGLSSRGGFACEAYPDGAIPTLIISGRSDHRAAVKGDHGLRFDPKQSQSAVEYEAVAKMPATKCKGCSHFRAPTGCQKVEGEISPEGWCKLWSNEPEPGVRDGTYEVRPDAYTADLPRGILDAISTKPLAAAGVMLVAGDKVLLLRRTNDGRWGFPGGKIEPGETAEQAAIRECEEEIGYTPTNLRPWTRRIKDGVDFTTFLSQIDEPFSPRYNDEHDAHEWADILDHVNSSLDALKLNADGR